MEDKNRVKRPPWGEQDIGESKTWVVSICESHRSANLKSDSLSFSTLFIRDISQKEVSPGDVNV